MGAGPFELGKLAHKLWERLKYMKSNSSPKEFNLSTQYRNDPKFSDGQVLANSADPDRSSLIRVYTVCNSVCIFWMHDSKVEPHCSNFRISTAVFRVSKFL